MYRILVVLLLLGAVLLATRMFPLIRERLEPTDKIKDLKVTTVEDSELDRVWSMVSPDTQEYVYNMRGRDLTLAKRWVMGHMRRFYLSAYEPSRKPMTEQDIQTYIDGSGEGYLSNDDKTPGMIRPILKSYFIDQPITQPTPAEETAASTPAPAEGNTASTPAPVEKKLDTNGPTTITINVGQTV